ncbi:MAG: aldo/keto reductase family protein, partial [Steroidobacter sp.]
MVENHDLMSSAGVAIPPILYGTAWKKEQTAELVSTALRIGFRGIDSACQPKHYNEPGVGEGVAMRLGAGLDRNDLYLQTKFTPLAGQAPNQVPYDPSAQLTEQVRQSFEASLRNLQTDYLDCLVLHSPLSREAETIEVWRAMEALVDVGGVRQLGLSNCYQATQLAQLYGSARIKPAVLQNRFYAQSDYDQEIRAFCRERGVVYQSFWTLTANRHVLASDVVASLASEYRRTP